MACAARGSLDQVRLRVLELKSAHRAGRMIGEPPDAPPRCRQHKSMRGRQLWCALRSIRLSSPDKCASARPDEALEAIKTHLEKHGAIMRRVLS